MLGRLRKTRLRFFTKRVVTESPRKREPYPPATVSLLTEPCLARKSAITIAAKDLPQNVRAKGFALTRIGTNRGMTSHRLPAQRTRAQVSGLFGTGDPRKCLRTLLSLCLAFGTYKDYDYTSSDLLCQRMILSKTGWRQRKPIAK
jgi:hypothetical protein